MLQSDAHSSITLEISVLVPEPAPPPPQLQEFLCPGGWSRWCPASLPRPTQSVFCTGALAFCASPTGCTFSSRHSLSRHLLSASRASGTMLGAGKYSCEQDRLGSCSWSTDSGTDSSQGVPILRPEVFIVGSEPFEPGAIALIQDH